MMITVLEILVSVLIEKVFLFKGCIIYDDKYEKIKDKIDNYFDGNYDEE